MNSLQNMTGDSIALLLVMISSSYLISLLIGYIRHRIALRAIRNDVNRLVTERTKAVTMVNIDREMSLDEFSRLLDEAVERSKQS